MKMSPGKLKFLLNWCFGPYLGAGVKIEQYSSDWRYCRVAMKLRWYNRNAVNTHFGGSLISMTDPHFMLMLMNILGKEYTVWDKGCEIDFVSPGTGKVSAEFIITDAMLEDIYQHTANGDKYLPNYVVKVVDEQQKTVCNINKTLYIEKRKNQRARF